MSALPAWLADFKNRGTLRVGDWADIIVYNLRELGYEHERLIYATDFPGGERRLIQRVSQSSALLALPLGIAKGLRYTIVNGTVTFEETECSGALPGKLLRQLRHGGRVAAAEQAPLVPLGGGLRWGTPYGSLRSQSESAQYPSKDIS